MPIRVPKLAALLALAFASASIFLHAEDPLPNIERLQQSPVLRGLVPNPVPSEPKSAPEKTVAQMHVREGFRVELVVGEPNLHQPIAFAFDERGRIWVAEAWNYPQKAPAGQGSDKIVIFEDNDGDGKFEGPKVFAENLNLVSGFELGHGGVWVGAAPELLFIPDRNRDDIPEGPPEVLLDGFGYQDTHECLNSFMWGPDGWLYGNQGVFNYAQIGKPGTPPEQRTELRAGIWRYHPVRRVFEVFAEGGSNQWGLDYDERGQIFMTHCRSYWGRGPTTHVIQGGHFWNQANANYAPFIIANPPPEFPDFKNYLLASARYGHGAGGAGPRGSDAIYGGHSHVGTMIYLGDNWPDEYRGRLFTHNLHGHQINQQVNRRLGSGWDTVHAGRDLTFCTDPKFVAVDLQYGPDGAVYMIDWYDQQHCHNPNTERWDRRNGRIYRLQYDASFKPAPINLQDATDAQLVRLQRHKNEWFGRTARRLLHERAAQRELSPGAREPLEELFIERDPLLRLRGLWIAHLIGRLDSDLARGALADPDEFIRAWAIQLHLDDRQLDPALESTLIGMARTDASPVVRLYLASALQRLPASAAWPIAEALAQHGEDHNDRNLPFLLWHGLAPLVPKNLDRAFTLAQNTALPRLADWIHWYAATLENNAALTELVNRLSRSQGEDQRRLLAAINLALKTRSNVPMPQAWPAAAEPLYASNDPRVRHQAEEIAAALGDQTRFPILRKSLANPATPPNERDHAFNVLSRAADPAALPAFLALLDEPPFRARAINALARLNFPEIPGALIQRFDQFSREEKSAALNLLCSRFPFAMALLDAVQSGQISREHVTAFHVRQLAALDHSALQQRVAATWGRFTQTAAEKEEQIARLEKIFNEAPLWAYDTSAGRQHFQLLCVQCHKLGEEGTRLGPELTGAGRNGIRYYLENIIAPNAVVGLDFQMTEIETRSGDLITGLLINETPSTLTLRTTTDEVPIAKSEIASRKTSENSMMPEGLLESLGDREQIELLKYLATH